MEYLTNIANALLLLANFVLVPAITYGSQLALGALGVTLVFAILRFSNFAHGEMMAFGTMFTILITWLLQSYQISINPLPTALLALPIAILLTIVCTLLIDQCVYRYHRRIKSSSITFLIVSIGIMFLLNGLTRMIIGPGDIIFTDGARFLLRASEVKKLLGLSEGLTIKTTQILVIVMSLLTVAALFWFLKKTKIGKSMRAYADNEDLALLSGVSPTKIVWVTWIIAATLATLAGTLYGLDKGFQPLNYFHLLLPIFAAAIVGGFGSPLGAIVGGYVIAFSEVMLTYAYKKFFLYLTPWQPEGLLQILSTEYKVAVSFVILVIVLLVRPTGIFKGSHN